MKYIKDINIDSNIITTIIQFMILTVLQVEVKKWKVLIITTTTGRNMKIYRSKIAFVRNINVFCDIFLTILQKTAANGADSEINAY